jgi:hypothetical protein
VNYMGWKQWLGTMSRCKFSGFLGSECSDCGPVHCDTVQNHKWISVFRRNKLSSSGPCEWSEAAVRLYKHSVWKVAIQVEMETHLCKKAK